MLISTTTLSSTSSSLAGVHLVLELPLHFSSPLVSLVQYECKANDDRHSNNYSSNQESPPVVTNSIPGHRDGWLSGTTSGVFVHFRYSEKVGNRAIVLHGSKESIDSCSSGLSSSCIFEHDGENNGSRCNVRTDGVLSWMVCGSSCIVFDLVNIFICNVGDSSIARRCKADSRCTSNTAHISGVRAFTDASTCRVNTSSSRTEALAIVSLAVAPACAHSVNALLESGTGS
mmetsp:Transcript_27057/g.69620  ORF Transcript_27057/g.69620 Transcript_27057/m.69620 type:complete len:230 (+) Transcript_27057:591-1280(+)